ncbi:hypothetical protein JY651_20110 [Pyxidicoccus parkwayensis]|uniref:Lipoprotein n=1 Tax=Pyxidicoccus parkwayensis TaxID=2813578 RepID=A0ABX7P9F1_9BACT|nr:hypothetical protein [Pyxidicoccus parkwaysis]QSQ27074.1 hypothetical protein JY651_20110 [Pyxidicoccus parkwaysis]
MRLNDIRWLVMASTLQLGACASSKPPPPAVAEVKRVPCPANASLDEDRKSFKAVLQANPSIDAKEIFNIVDGYQVGSLHSFAARKLEAMAEFVEEGNVLRLPSRKTPGEMIEVKNLSELTDYIKSADPAIDIMNLDC